MLILTRKVNQSLMVGDDITVTVVEVKGDQVRLAINAPSEVIIRREGIHERIRREQRRAHSSSRLGTPDY